MQSRVTKILLAIAFMPAALASWFLYREMYASAISYVISLAMFVFIWLLLFAVQGAVMIVCGYYSADELK
jgi:hypothetical protein|tara:strand:+ start:1471 stop:1680 length:210 start_codon:yes stop_codon:yes gene_type:complete